MRDKIKIRIDDAMREKIKIRIDYAMTMISDDGSEGESDYPKTTKIPLSGSIPSSSTTQSSLGRRGRSRNAPTTQNGGGSGKRSYLSSGRQRNRYVEERKSRHSMKSKSRTSPTVKIEPDSESGSVVGALELCDDAGPKLERLREVRLKIFQSSPARYASVEDVLSNEELTILAVECPQDVTGFERVLDEVRSRKQTYAPEFLAVMKE